MRHLSTAFGAGEAFDIHSLARYESICSAAIFSQIYLLELAAYSENCGSTSMGIKVIYIMGFSHSGSTLLDAILASSQGIFGAGELAHLVSVTRDPNAYCACGAVASKCDFWSQVFERWNAKYGGVDRVRYCATQAYYQRYRRYGWYRYGRPEQDGDFMRHAVHTHALFAAISEVSQSDWIIDSSKNPIRAMMLAQMPGIDPYVIHLTRDVRGVVYSRTKPAAAAPRLGRAHDRKSLSSGRVFSRWMVSNLTADHVRYYFGQRGMLLRQEDFVRYPVSSVDRIGRLSGLDLSEVTRGIENGQPVSGKHTIAGNRLRMSNDIRIDPDQAFAWQSRLPPIRSRLMRLASYPLSKRYGYL